MDAIFFPGKFNEHEVRVITGNFIIGAAGAVTAYEGAQVASVAKNGLGIYDITLKQSCPKFLYANLVPMSAAAANYSNQLVSETVISTKIVKFRSLTAGAAADPASGVKFYFVIVLRNLSI